MKPIRIFRHVACEGPGYLGTFLDRRGLPWQVVCIDESHPVPARTDDVSGLVFMGGSMSVHDPLAWIAEEIDLIRHAVEVRLPVMGICFGGQLLARALGAEVRRGDGMEIGWHDLERVAGCHCEDWLSGLPDRFEAFHWHADTFDIPAGSDHLLASRCYYRQAFAAGPHLGMQFHLEMTEEMVRGWIEHYGSDLAQTSPCIQTAEAMTAGLSEHVHALHGVADRVYGAWMGHVLRYAGGA